MRKFVVGLVVAMLVASSTAALAMEDTCQGSPTCERPGADE